MSGKSGGGCLKSLVVGCLAAIGLVVVLAVGLWMSRDAIRQSSWYQGLRGKVEAVKEEAKSLTELRSRLMTSYPAENVNVQFHVNSINGKSSHVLLVQIVNPTFALPDDDSGKQAKAREIAEFVAREHPGITRYDQLRISFVRSGGTGVTFNSSADFDFPVADLLPAETPGSAPSGSSQKPKGSQ